MKTALATALLFSALFSAVTSQAQTTLPNEVRETMVRFIGSKCGIYRLAEGSTTKWEQQFDDQANDFYQTEFTAKFNFDGAHPVDTRITITAITDARGSFVDISKLSADLDGACK